MHQLREVFQTESLQKEWEMDGDGRSLSEDLAARFCGCFAVARHPKAGLSLVQLMGIKFVLSICSTWNQVVS